MEENSKTQKAKYRFRELATLLSVGIVVVSLFLYSSGLQKRYDRYYEEVDEYVEQTISFNEKTLTVLNEKALTTLNDTRYLLELAYSCNDYALPNCPVGEIIYKSKNHTRCTGSMSIYSFYSSISGSGVMCHDFYLFLSTIPSIK